MNESWKRIASSIFCLGLIAGCGSGAGDMKLAQVNGIVSYKGAPVAGANVTFLPEKGPMAMGFTNLKGEFSLKTGGLSGCALGPVKVAVAIPVDEEATSTFTATTPAPGDAAAFAEMSKKMADATTQRQKEDAKKPKSPIPLRYKDPKTSSLQFTVDSNSSKNKFKIELND